MSKDCFFRGMSKDCFYRGMSKDCFFRGTSKECFFRGTSKECFSRGTSKECFYRGTSKECFYKGEACTMADYNRLKSTLLDMQPRAWGSGDQTQENRMDRKRAVVDAMFKYMDVNGDSRLESQELAQISVKEHLEDSLLECSMQDLIRYDDYNNDGHLSLQEFYTAFQVIQLTLPEEKQVSVSTVTVGLSTVLSCAIQGTLRPPIIWRRNGIVLNFLDLEDINVRPCK
ncbi:hypothetical protein COCON_G00084770 [Conger conger]|uniref:EF-hand domain-containing protein n=1 Tax=Conger conger TaxID=82655 RepID=A0A9Q1I329_CONCO|nr:hypothetical protein COCON_G00084770 [Conger conger]